MEENKMHCRKCGCEILETDERCPMCDSKQRSKKTKRYASDSVRRRKEEKKENAGKRRIVALFVLFGVFGVFFLVVSFLNSRFHLFYFDLFNQSRPTIAEKLIFIDRIDGHTTGHNGIHMTEDRVYITENYGDIIIFDHNMNYVETINIDKEVMFFDDDRNHVADVRLTNRHLEARTLYVTDESIYFIGNGLGFLRYDFNTEIVEHIAEVPSRPGANCQWIYFNDPFNSDRFFYISSVHRRNLYEVYIPEESRQRIASNVSAVAVIPDYLLLVKRNERQSFSVYLHHEETGEVRDLGIELSVPCNMVVIGDDLFISDQRYRILYRKSLSEEYVREISNQVWWFAIAGEYIIYTPGSTSDIYLMDLEGNRIRTLISYEMEWNESREYRIRVRTEP